MNNPVVLHFIFFKPDYDISSNYLFDFLVYENSLKYNSIKIISLSIDSTESNIFVGKSNFLFGLIQK